MTVKTVVIGGIPVKVGYDRSTTYYRPLIPSGSGKYLLCGTTSYQNMIYMHTQEIAKQHDGKWYISHSQEHIYEMIKGRPEYMDDMSQWTRFKKGGSFSSWKIDMPSTVRNSFKTRDEAVRFCKRYRI